MEPQRVARTTCRSLDPSTHTASRVLLQVRDPLTPTTASTPPMMPSPYWGEEVIWDSQSNAHSFAMDSQARVWIAARVRPAETPAFCQEGSSHPSAQVFPIERSNRQIQLWDPKTKKITTVDTCFGTHHLNFDDDNKLWFTGSGPVVAWFDTKVLDETGDEELAQGWTVQVLDTNGNGRRDEYVEPGEAGRFHQGHADRSRLLRRGPESSRRIDLGFDTGDARRTRQARAG